MPEGKGFLAGDEVIAVGRDYRFTGTVVCVFYKLNGKERYVVEHPDGILHIFSAPNLVKIDYANPDSGLATEE